VSNLKEYSNRIGRTARMNAYGESLSFCMLDTPEKEYPSFLKEKAGFTEILSRNRFKLL
jgi:superfamily II DNA/RNA helicase